MGRGKGKERRGGKGRECICEDGYRGEQSGIMEGVGTGDKGDKEMGWKDALLGIKDEHGDKGVCEGLRHWDIKDGFAVYAFEETMMFGN